MATSGEFEGTVTGNSSIISKISWVENSYSTTNNTSSVTVNLSYKRKDTQSTYGTGTWKLNINGKSYSSTSYKNISGSWVKVFSQTVTITHDSNGAKTFSMNASGSYIPGTSLEGTNCSGSGTLTTIPRASSFDSVTSSVNVGETVTIKITAKSSAFYHKIIWTCGSASVTQTPGQVATTNQKSYTYTIPTTWANQIPNATSKTASVKVQTYSNEACTVAVGSAITKNFTVKIPNTATYKPSVSLSTTLGNATAVGSYYIQGKTKITLNASSGAAGSGAKIKSYTFKRGPTVIKTNTSEATTSSTSETTSTPGNSINYSVTITDSRGRTATATKTVKVYAYSAPEITINKCYRSDSSGAEKRDSGTYIYTMATFSASDINSKNTVTATIQYKKKESTDSYSSAVSISSGTGLVIGNDTISINDAYSVLITVTDKVGTHVTKETTIPTIFVIMDFKDGGTGISIGKIATKNYLFDVGLNMQVNSITTNEAKIDFLASGFNTRSVLHSGYGNFGFYDLTDTAWLMRFDTNKNCVIPSGKFSAPKSIVMGSVSITPTAANTPTGKAVNLGTMAGTPRVVATPATTVPGKEVTGVGVGSPSSTSVTIYLTRTNTTACGVNYIAVCV